MRLRRPRRDPRELVVRNLAGDVAWTIDEVSLREFNEVYGEDGESLTIYKIKEKMSSAIFGADAFLYNDNLEDNIHIFLGAEELEDAKQVADLFAENVTESTLELSYVVDEVDLVTVVPHVFDMETGDPY